MLFLSTEFVELAIVSLILLTLVCHFKSGIFRDQNLFLVSAGLSLAILGLLLHFLYITPFKSVLVDLLGEWLASYLGTILYIPCGILLLWGMHSWFAGVIQISREIKRRKKAEDELEASNEMIAQVLNSSSQGILLLDSDYKVKLTNKRLLELLDLPEHLGQPGTHYRELVQNMVETGEYGVGAGETAKVYRQWIELLNSQHFFHFQRTRPSGIILDIEARWIPNMGLLATYTDITKQAKAELELTKSEEKFRDFTDTASDWMWEVSPDYRLTYISELGQKLSGRSLEEILGTRLEKLLEFFEGRDEWEMLIEASRQEESFSDFQTLYIHPDKSRRHYSLSGKPIYNTGGEFIGYRGIGRDITARKQVEEQLQQSQKMEAIGRLTGGIAHDFNNLLAVLLGNTELLRETLAKEEGLSNTLLDNLERATLRGAELTQQLLSYSRKQQLRPTTVDLAEDLSDIVSLIGRSLGEDIKIDVTYQDGLWPAHTDPGQLQNAILNLANNARDAMPNGGKLQIFVQNHQQQAVPKKECCDFPAGDYVAVSVKDTGCGIPAEIVEKIFEPFFTTKEVGKGTGLGLSMVFGFAKQSGGHVCIESSVGEGTEVILFLPRAVETKRLSA